MTRQLWMLNHYASRPDETGIRHFALARALLNQGWETTIIAASTRHPSGELRPGHESRTTDEVIDGVKFRWLRVPEYENGVRRVINMLAFTIALIRRRSTQDLPAPHAIIGSSVHPLTAWAGSILARRRKAPFFFEMRDLWPQTLIEMGAISQHGLVAKLMRVLERRLCARAERVITTMPFAVEYLETQGVPREKVVWISNGVHVAEFEWNAPPTNEAFEFLYFGTLGTANHVDLLIDAYAPLAGRPEQPLLRIIGDGPRRAELAEQARRLGLSHRVHFEGRVSKGAIPQYAAAADCLVVATLPLAIYNYGMSLNKLFEYMAAGRPIVFAGDVRGNPVAASGGGICTSGGISETTAALAEVLSASPTRRAEMGAKARAFAEREFDFSTLAAKLSATLRPHGGAE